MTSPLSRALGDDDPNEKPRYTVDVAQRIREVMGDSLIGELDRVTYEWSAGYEHLRHELHGGGASDYAGSYHPNDGYCRAHEPGACGGRDGHCPHDGICTYCGRTLM